MSPQLEPYVVLGAPRNSTGLYLTGTYKATVEADELIGMPNLFVQFIIYDAIEYHSQIVRIAMIFDKIAPPKFAADLPEVFELNVG